MKRVIEKGTLTIEWNEKVGFSHKGKSQNIFKGVRKDNVDRILSKRRRSNIKTARFIGHNGSIITFLESK